MCDGKSLFPLLGRCRGELQPWEEDGSCALSCCFSSSSLSGFFQIHPVIYCSPCFSFLLPAFNFWAALPQEGAFGRREGFCHASKHPLGSLPASHWIQLKLTLSKAPQTQTACALTWDEPLNHSQPHPLLWLWQAAETSCFLSHFQRALRREGWVRSSLFLRAELARFALCPPHWQRRWGREGSTRTRRNGAAAQPWVRRGGQGDKECQAGMS